MKFRYVWNRVRLITTLGIATAIINLLLLLPTPFEQVKTVKAYSDTQRIEQAEQTTNERDQLTRNVAFSESRKITEIWIRWIAVAMLCGLHILSVTALVRSGSRIAYVGMSVTSSIYLLGWASSIVILGDPLVASIMDKFMYRILNEIAIGHTFWIVRFFLLYCFNPLAFLVILKASSLQLDNDQA